MDEVDRFIAAHMPGTAHRTASLLTLGLLELVINCNVVASALAMPRLQKQLSLSPDQVSTLCLSNSVGGVLGFGLSALLARNIGNARLAQVSMLLQTCSSFALYEVDSFGLYVLLWTANGMLEGFLIPIILSSVIAIAPQEARGYWVSVVSLFTSGGRVVAALLCFWLIAESDLASWKSPFFPIAIAFLVFTVLTILILKEPPRHLLTTRSFECFVATFNQILNFNNWISFREDPPINPSNEELEKLARSCEPTNGLSIRTLLSKEYLLLNLSMVGIASTSTMIFGGQIFVLAFWYADPKARSNFLEVALTFCAEFFAIFTASQIIDKPWGGRRKSLQCFSLAITILFSVQAFVADSLYMLLIFFGARLFAKGLIIIMRVVVGESYPTQIKTSALGAVFTLSGLMCVGQSWVLPDLFEWNQYSVFWLFLSSSLSLLVYSVSVPKDKARESRDLAAAAPLI